MSLLLTDLAKRLLMHGDLILGDKQGGSPLARNKRFAHASASLRLRRLRLDR